MTTAALSVTDTTFSDAERCALAGFLAGYRGLTSDAYALDLRQFAAWCLSHNLRLFEVRRGDIECFALTSRNWAGLGPRWPVACARWPASTAMPSRTAFWTDPRPCMSAAPPRL